MVHLSSKPVSWLILYLTPGKQVPLSKIKEKVFTLLILSNVHGRKRWHMVGKKTLVQRNFLTLGQRWLNDVAPTQLGRRWPCRRCANVVMTTATMPPLPPLRQVNVNVLSGWDERACIVIAEWFPLTAKYYIKLVFPDLFSRPTVVLSSTIIVRGLR